MKKIVFLASLMCATMAMAAPTITATSQIDLSTAGQTDKYVRFVLSSSFSNGFDNTWDTPAANESGIYVYYDGARYTGWASNEYSENLPLGFYTGDNTAYTLKFSNFMGTTYEIYDVVADETIVVNGSTADYNFTIDASERNSQINDRFYINYNSSAFFTITTNAYGFCSFASSEAATLPAGLKAYKGAFDESDYSLTLTYIGQVVPANEGVILWTPEEINKDFKCIKGGSAPVISGNDFKGAVAPKPVAEISADAIYCLHGNELQEYVGTEDIPAGKAYLPVTLGGGAAPRRITMRFHETTAISNVEVSEKAEKFVQDGQILIRRGNEVYNLQGQIVK